MSITSHITSFTNILILNICKEITDIKDHLFLKPLKAWFFYIDWFQLVQLASILSIRILQAQILQVVSKRDNEIGSHFKMNTFQL